MVGSTAAYMAVRQVRATATLETVAATGKGWMRIVLLLMLPRCMVPCIYGQGGPYVLLLPIIDGVRSGSSTRSCPRTTPSKNLGPTPPSKMDPTAAFSRTTRFCQGLASGLQVFAERGSARLNPLGEMRWFASGRRAASWGLGARQG